MVKLKKGFSLSDLWVYRYDKVTDFYVSSWQKGESGTPLLIVRLILAMTAVGMTCWSIAFFANRWWLIYLTNWGLLLVAGTMLSALLVSIMAKRRDLSNDTEELPWYVSMYWLLTNVNVTIALLITILYWALLFSTEIERSTAAFALDIFTHGLNSFVSLIELFASRTPVKLAHIYQPLALGLWYAAFSAIYYAAGGLNQEGNPFIYDVLDWRDGANAAIIVAIATAGAFAMYILVWLAAKARDKISVAIIRTTSQDLPLAPPLTPVPDV